MLLISIYYATCPGEEDAVITVMLAQQAFTNN